LQKTAIDVRKISKDRQVIRGENV